MRKPGIAPGFKIVRRCRELIVSELVVQAEAAEQVTILKAEAATGAAKIWSIYSRLAKIDIERFYADGPIAEEGIFKATTRGPAGFPFVIRARAGIFSRKERRIHCVLNIAKSQAAGRIKQRTIIEEGITE